MGTILTLGTLELIFAERHSYYYTFQELPATWPGFLENAPLSDYTAGKISYGECVHTPYLLRSIPAKERMEQCPKPTQQNTKY
jgi:hypothetical protein